MLRYIFTWLWHKTGLRLWSLVVNISLWLKLQCDLERSATVEGLLYLYSIIVNSETRVNEILSSFKWRADRCYDWRPWISVILYKDLRDDCDGAAVLAAWLFSLANFDAEVRTFVGVGWTSPNHAVCIVNLRGEFAIYSNGRKVRSDINKKNLIARYANSENEWGAPFYKRII